MGSSFNKITPSSGQVAVINYLCRPKKSNDIILQLRRAWDYEMATHSEAAQQYL